MTISKAAQSLNKKNARRVREEVTHYAKVFTIALTIGAAIKIGLPRLSIEDGRFSLGMDWQRLLGAVILLVAILALSEWLRRPTKWEK